MTVILASRLQSSDLDWLGHDLAAVVRADRRACRAWVADAAASHMAPEAVEEWPWSAVERSLACLGETLPAA